MILQHVQVRKTDTLLDVGCGTGIATVLFPCEKVGIDPSAELLKQASFKTIVGRAESLPFPDNSFDIVICMTAIHHCEVDKALAEIKRVAKRDVVVTVLKKARNSGDIVKKIERLFNVTKIINEEKDYILVCTPFRNT